MKRSSGANNFAGITAQARAALSLFLSVVNDPNFLSIELEQPKLADFNLVFSNKKIICESKDYHISYATVRNILRTIPMISANDEILIICKSVDKKVIDDLKYAEHLPEIREKLTSVKKFSQADIAVLPKISFWAVGKEFDENAITGLLIQNLNTWIPEDDLKRLTNDLLIRNVYKKSSESGKYSAEEFRQELSDYKKRLIEKDDYSTKKNTALSQAKKVILEVENLEESRLLSDNRLGALVAQPKLHYFAMEQVKAKGNIDLFKWAKLWDATFTSYYSRQVFGVFKDNIESQENAAYALSFIEKHASEMPYRINDEFAYKEAADILEKIQLVLPNQDTRIAKLLMAFYSYSARNILYFNTRNKGGADEWIREEIGKSLSQVCLESSNTGTHELVLDFIYSNFNLVGDDSNFWHETPPSIFHILRTYIEKGYTTIEDFIEKVVDSYDRSYGRYFKNPAYKGWDLFGSTVSNFGGAIDMHDKTFLTSVIVPILKGKNAEDAWSFVVKNVSRKENDVSRERPDFLNRAAIPILIREYVAGNHADEAKSILTDFIKMRHGIPHKTYSIYQIVRNSQEMSPDQKWELLQIGIKEYGYPINPFMDQVLQGLLGAGNVDALNLFKTVISNERYLERQAHLDSQIPNLLATLLNNDETRGEGADLLKVYFSSSHFNEKVGAFDAYDLKTSFLLLVEKDFTLGMQIIKDAILGKPTKNQQAVFGAVLRDMPDNLVLKAYEEIVANEIGALTNEEFAKKYTPGTRENFVWFGDKLAKQKRFSEALKIARFFINDPDPEINNDYDKRIIKGESDFTINTVRGSLPWIVIASCVVGARKHIPELFEITKRLCSDPTLYVREQACLALEGLVNVRHSRLPKSNEWFLEHPLAQQIEDLAFAMLSDTANHRPAIMKRLANVFSRIRTLDEKQALTVINEFKNLDEDIFEDLSGFIIFMAEFRKDAFKDWPQDRGSMAKYNSKPVREELLKLIADGKSGIRQNLAWHFNKLPDEIKEGDKRFDKLFSISLEYLNLLANNYDNSVFRSIYDFIEDHIDKQFDACHSLWRKCLKVELAAIKKELKANPSGHNTFYWWPYHYNDNILLKVAEKKGSKAFLEDLETLLNYAPDILIASNLDKIVNYLSGLSEQKQRVDKLFNKLIERNLKYQEEYKQWKASQKKP